MEPTTMKINNVEYVRKDSLDQCEGDVKICILQRGWVMVGRFERKGSDCKLNNASIIRVWGTTQGLGQIALGGPTKDTKLDKCHGVVEFDYLTVVATLSCNDEAWKCVL